MARADEVVTRGVMFTDMVGSTALRSRLGEHRADVLSRAHDELVAAAVAANRGRVLRWTGDGVKASFASASAAVSAAIDIQRAVAGYGRQPDAIAEFELRIGVSVGEVAEVEGDDHGVAVIEASRLEALAGPGEILATDLVARLSDRRVDATFDEVGERVLKGLDRPVAIVRVVDAFVNVVARPVPRSLTLDRRFPLVGRADDLAMALRCWRDAVDGSGGAVLVSGPPGIGKSRFVAQIADRAHVEGAIVLGGVCDSELAVPYQPFARAFSALVHAGGTDEELVLAVGEGRGTLGPLFPTRQTGRGGELGAAERFELFEAVRVLVGRLAAERPVLLVLDDLQWATLPTAQLLRHLLCQDEAARLLVVGTLRSDEVGPGHPLMELLVDLRADRRVSRITLGSIEAPDVAELVTARVPSAPRENVADFARRVHDESAGSPFFVCELLHHLASTGDLQRLVHEGVGDRLPIPESVREVVDQRIARLPADAQELLSIAAVVGLDFDLELLSSLMDRPFDDVLALLEDLARVAVVVEADAGRFAFSHAITRGTLLDRLSATRRAIGHRRVAEAITALGRPAHDELAHHWLNAGVEDEACVHLELAGRRDMAALAYESAEERYVVVLELLSRRSSPDLAAQGRAWLGLALAQRAQGVKRYLGSVNEAAGIARRLHDPNLLIDVALASIWPGSFVVRAGLIEHSLVSLCEDALEVVGAGDPRRVRMLATLVAHLAFDPDEDRKADLIREADELARSIGDPALIGDVLTAEYMSIWNMDSVDRRRAISIELGRMARASGDVDHACFAGITASIAAAEQCDVAAARLHLAAVAKFVSASHNFYFGFLHERFGVSLDVLTCRSDLQPTIDDLARRFEGTHSDTEGTWAVQTGGCARQAGTLGTMADSMREMIEQSNLAPNWVGAYGCALASNGDLAGAHGVLDDFVEPSKDYFWLTTMQSAAELAAILGRQVECHDLFDTLFPYRGQLGIVGMGSMCLSQVSLTLGNLAVAVARYDEAVELLTETIERADAMGARFDAVRGRRLLAQARLAIGHSHDEVRALITDAMDEATKRGFAGEVRDLRQLLERCR